MKRAIDNLGKYLHLLRFPYVIAKLAFTGMGAWPRYFINVYGSSFQNYEAGSN